MVKLELPEAQYVAITPEMAQQWLLQNSVNRKLRPTTVGLYARDMRADRWSLNQDAIAFSPEGLLLNGQHRLTAVVRSGRTVTMLVTGRG